MRQACCAPGAAPRAAGAASSSSPWPWRRLTASCPSPHWALPLTPALAAVRAGRSRAQNGPCREREQEACSRKHNAALMPGMGAVPGGLHLTPGAMPLIRWRCWCRLALVMYLM